MKLEAIKLRTALYKKDWTQKDLSRKSCLHIITVNRVCNGGSCTYETAMKIANALKMDLNDLIEQKGARDE